MKATGIVRKIDGLGRIVLPKEIRRTNNWSEGDGLEIYTGQDGSVTLKKYAPGCVFCGGMDNMIRFHCRQICSVCAASIAKSIK